MADKWPAVLREMSRAVGAAEAVIMTRSVSGYMGWRHSVADGAAILDGYLASDVAMSSLTSPRLIAANHAGFLSRRDLLTDDEWHVDPVRTEAMEKLGWKDAAASAIHAPTGDFVIVQVNHQADHGMGSTEIRTLDAFRPHLARASLLAARWKLEQMRTATEALALLGLPAAVINVESQVLVANELMQKSPYVRWGSKNRIALVDRAATVLLDRVVASDCNSGGANARSFPCRAGKDTTPAVVHFVPTRRNARDLFEGGYGILLITAVARTAAPGLTLIQGLFDLSPGEAKVAAAIVEGLTNAEIATRQDVSVETIRSQIGAVLSKTGFRRRIDVATHLASIPRLGTDPY